MMPAGSKHFTIHVYVLASREGEEEEGGPDTKEEEEQKSREKNDFFFKREVCGRLV